MITKLLTAPRNPYSVRSSGAIWLVGATFIAVVHVCVVEFTCILYTVWIGVHVFTLHAQMTWSHIH